jgi:hypothetical protein
VVQEVAVKVLRPNMLQAIEKDLNLMRMMAGWLEKISADGKRLKPREVVAEFDKHLHDELDLVREAANGAQLRRNMQSLNLVGMFSLTLSVMQLLVFLVTMQLLVLQPHTFTLSQQRTVALVRQLHTL